MVLLTLTIFIFSVLLYNKLEHDLYQSVDNLLQSRAEGIADSIDTYWEVKKLESKKRSLEATFSSKRNELNFAKIAEGWVHEESNTPELFNLIIQIFDAKGQLIATSKNTPETIMFPKEFFSSARLGKQRLDTTTVTFSDKQELTVRVLTTPVVQDNAIMYIVQVARSLDTIQSALNDFKQLLFVLLPLLIFFTGIIGALLAKITLSPVNRIIKSVKKIKADNLKQRVHVPGTNDEIQLLAATFNDLLERIEHTFTAQRHFIQDASHELKTPLTIMQGELEVTLKKMRTVSDYETVLRSSLEEIKRISKIVENLLLLARVENQEAALDRKELDLYQLLRSVIDDMEILAHQKNIALQFAGDEGLLISADEQKLKQTFINILDNAVKYTSPDHGHITINLIGSADAAEISFRDTGIGIPRDELPHIFERFYRVDKSRSSNGFGLGLSIAKSIIEAHRGTIAVESVLTQGTTITVSLPLSQPKN
jgi:heavy metal sensor kinase